MPESITLPPLVIIPSVASIESVAQEYLNNPNPDALVVREAPITQRFVDMNMLFTDADGTFVPEGATKFSKRNVNAIGHLASVGVRAVIVTGKPFTEVEALATSLPKGVVADIIYEKGAYLLERNRDGTIARKTCWRQTKTLWQFSCLKRLF
ncbi:HAD hydrolase family protein [Candidatus Saccharibacteria bacterium]|nr:MAG: HAD hydrolase family protein [Candidatus Saccharibacteria bacterium]